MFVSMFNIEVNKTEIDALEQKLLALSRVRFNAVVKKQVTQMLNTARSSGGSGSTPVDTGELRKSSGTYGDEMGYLSEYAPHVEYGHRTVDGNYVPGQHFLRDNVNIQGVIFKQDLLKAIKKEGG